MIDNDDTSPGAAAQQQVETSRLGSAPTTIPAGERGNEDGDEDRRVIGDPAAPLSAISDPSGKLSNRVEGTIQREPKPEDLPPDAKVAPQAEQLAPNAAPIAVGAREQPEVIAGVELPPEGEKNVVPDTSDPKQFLSPSSDQGDQADLAANIASDSADRASATAAPAINPEGKSKAELDSESTPDKPATT